MAQRRMFSLKVVDTDAFLDMPSSSQLLYFHLAMRGDDDGFVSNPKKILRMIGGSDDDYKVLTSKKFIIQFETGVCVIKHWRIHNYLQNDRYSRTQYTKELESLTIDPKTKKYSLILNENNKCIQPVYKMYTEPNLTKPNIDNNEKISSSNNSLPNLYEKMGLPKKVKISTYKWQDEAANAIQYFEDGESKASSIFKCFKENNQKAKIALLDCKDLNKKSSLYFLKVYNEIK